jgi:hypothetical protein
MILYTEKELIAAYRILSIPTLEEFRIIFEDYWKEEIDNEQKR